MENNNPSYNIKINDLKEKLICPICLDFFKKPILDKCGHSYCKSCFLAWLSKSDKCPMSLKKINDNFSSNLILKELIDTMILKCKKCDKKILLIDLDNHDFYCDLEKMKKNLKNVNNQIGNLNIKKDLIEKNIEFLKNEMGINKKIENNKRGSFFGKFFWGNKK